MKKQTFGAPKPLAGQAGYKVSEAERLEREAKEMETRLRMLQERLKDDEEKISTPIEKSGTKWKSAREDKGSVRSYAKDVQEKIKLKTSKQGVDLMAKATSKGRRTVRESEEGGNYKSKGIDKWGVNDVTDWLSGMMLNQYCQVFQDNEIAGSLVLDISLEDLDYMGITILGHRKVILKSIEDLRKNKRLTQELTAPVSGVSSTQAGKVSAPIRTSSDPDMQRLRFESRSAEGLPMHRSHQDASSVSSNSSAEVYSSNAVAGERRSSKLRTAAPAPVPVHWSDAPPLAANKVTNEEPTVNLADGDLDEAAERLAFQRAVEEWRNAGKSPTATGGTASSAGQGSTSSGGSGPGGQRSSGMWSNPFSTGKEDDGDGDGDGDGDESKEGKGEGGLADGDLDEAAERAAFQAAVAEWRNMRPASSSSVVVATGVGGTGKAPADNARGDSSRASMSSVGSRGLGGLADGTLDEAKEHEAFRQAVEAWRTGEGEGEGGRRTADRLSADLQAQYEHTAAELQRQQEVARMRLQEANRSLMEARTRATAVRANHEKEREEGEAGDDDLKLSDYEHSQDEEDEDEEEETEGKYGRANGRRTSAIGSSSRGGGSGGTGSRPVVFVPTKSSKRDEEEEEEEGQLSPASSLGDPREESYSRKGGRLGTPRQHHVEVSLIESTMGQQDDFAESYYNVDLVDSDDECGDFESKQENGFDDE